MKLIERAAIRFFNFHEYTSVVDVVVLFRYKKWSGKWSKQMVGSSRMDAMEKAIKYEIKRLIIFMIVIFFFTIYVLWVI
ncbi:MAG: hypothetical protein ACTSWL_10385 [Promethearchaeota archaeon]